MGRRWHESSSSPHSSKLINQSPVKRRRSEEDKEGRGREEQSSKLIWEGRGGGTCQFCFRDRLQFFFLYCRFCLGFVTQNIGRKNSVYPKSLGTCSFSFFFSASRSPPPQSKSGTRVSSWSGETTRQNCASTSSVTHRLSKCDKLAERMWRGEERKERKKSCLQFLRLPTQKRPLVTLSR